MITVCQCLCYQFVVIQSKVYNLRNAVYYTVHCLSDWISNLACVSAICMWGLRVWPSGLSVGTHSPCGLYRLSLLQAQWNIKHYVIPQCQVLISFLSEAFSMTSTQSVNIGTFYIELLWCNLMITAGIKEEGKLAIYILPLQFVSLEFWKKC